MAKLQAIYTVSQLADISGISPRTLWHWLQTGRLQPMRVGKLVFVSLISLRDSQPELWASICMKNALVAGECEACGGPIKP
jgi:hypothetical protein